MKIGLLSKRIFTVIFILFPIFCCAQTVGLKTNALYLATTTPNLGIEFSLSEKVTFDLSGGYNFFQFDTNGSTNRKLLHWSVLLEGRYWFCRKYQENFVGLHGLYSKYNIEDVPFFSNKRYVGDIIGGGLTYGHHWAMGKSWGFEISVSLGVAYLDYDEYECGDCGKFKERNNKWYYGPTKATISFVYFIK